MKRPLLAAIATAWFCFGTGLACAEDAPSAPRILMISQSGGFKHGSVTRPDNVPLSPAERALTEWGIASGLYRLDCSQNIADAITKEKLANYNLVCFYTTGKTDELPRKSDLGDEKFKAWEEQRNYFVEQWLKEKGHGFIGVHSATDTYADWEPYYSMIGGSFDGHPWGSEETVAINVHDKNHPAAKPWGDSFEIKDEIYRFKNWHPENVHVIMSLDMAHTKLKEPYHVPIAWCKENGQGRVFYMSLGHREETWQNPQFKESMLGAIKWLLCQEAGDATPNPELSAQQDTLAKEVVANQPKKKDKKK